MLISSIFPPCHLVQLGMMPVFPKPLSGPTSTWDVTRVYNYSVDLISLYIQQ